jgi:hypothetical protein
MTRWRLLWQRVDIVTRRYGNWWNVTYQGFTWLIKQVCDLMIEFIEPLYNLLQYFTNHYLRMDTLDFWPHYTSNWTISFFCQSHIATDGQSISKSWSRAPSGAHDQIFITLWQLGSWFCERPLWRENGSVFCICCWPSPGSRSRVRVPWDSWPYFTVSVSSLLII